MTLKCGNITNIISEMPFAYRESWSRIADLALLPRAELLSLLGTGTDLPGKNHESLLRTLLPSLTQHPPPRQLL